MDRAAHRHHRVGPCEPICGPPTTRDNTDYLCTSDRRREPFVAEREGGGPTPPMPGEGKMEEEKKKQEKALALSLR